MGAISFDEIDHLADRRLGTYDVPCPLCGPSKRSAAKQNKRVLRIWRREPNFATFSCARCDESGYACDGSATATAHDPAALRRAQAEAAERERIASAKKLRTAKWLWSVSALPMPGSIAERYLRVARGCGRPMPATLRYLPSRGEYASAMIAAFGLAHETEPGAIAIADDAIRGVHLTRLLSDGSDRVRADDAGDADDGKIMIARSVGWPIVLAPPNDLLGLAITEGIEDALSVHEATGLGAWAAGSASRMPRLAEVVPDHVEAVTIYAHDDPDGRRFAKQLAELLHARGDLDVFVEGLPL